MKFNSFKLRILTWFASLVTVILFIFSFFLYHLLNLNINSKIQHNLFKTAKIVENEIEINQTNIFKDKRLANYKIIIYKNKRLIFKKGNINFKKLMNKINNRQFAIFENGDFINAVYILNNSNKSLKIIIYKKNINDKIENIVHIMFISELMLLFLLIFIGNFLIDKTLWTIKSITKTAKNISIDNFSSTIPLPKYEDETRELVLAFNEMIFRLKEGTKKIERFNSNVSHELKTPLTVIKGEIEIATLKTRDIKYYQNLLKKIETQTTQIQTIIENLLLLTKYTKENIKQTFKMCSFDSILLNVVESFDSQIKEKNIKLHIKKLENININANETLINTIFSNLIDNAIKYTPNGKNIYISLFTKNKKIYFIIKDEGIGIPKEKIDKITDRFYRVDESRNKSIKGFGLGLSIVKNYIELHNGTLKIKSKENIGTEIKISL